MGGREAGRAKALTCACMCARTRVSVRAHARVRARAGAGACSRPRACACACVCECIYTYEHLSHAHMRSCENCCFQFRDVCRMRPFSIGLYRMRSHTIDSVDAQLRRLRTGDVCSSRRRSLHRLPPRQSLLRPGLGLWAPSQ